MKAVLLAAGLGTRLRPVTNTIPKCLVPINGKPLLDYWLEMLVEHPQIDEIFVNLHYKADLVSSHLSNHWSTNNITCWYEPELLGTAGTLVKNYKALQGEECLVIHADNFSLFDMSIFLEQHKSAANSVAITMMLFETDQPKNCGIVELSSENKVIVMHEKVPNPPGNLANGAVYIFAPHVLEFIYKRQLSDISNQVIPHFCSDIQGWLNDTYHRDIGTVESLQQAQIDAKQLLKKTPAIKGNKSNVDI